MSLSCVKKQEQVKNLFLNCRSEEEKYQKIIELGRSNPPLENTLKNPDHEVAGCQSTLYLVSNYQNGKIFFQAESDALISAGLAVLLLMVYSGESPETILTCPPDYLEDLGISASLSPNRASGLYSIHLRMKQEALKHLSSTKP